MMRTVETLEQRTFLSVTPAVYRADVAAVHAQQRSVGAQLAALSKVEAGQRRTLVADVKRLHLQSQSKTAMANLVRQETLDLKALSKDAAVFNAVSNRDLVRLNAAAVAAVKHPTAVLQARYELDLSLMQSDISTDQQTFLNQLYSVLATNEVADLHAIGALSSDAGLTADIAAEVAGIATAATPVYTALSGASGAISTAFGDVTGVKFFGTQNLFGFNFTNNTDPLSGASLKGLAPGASSLATNAYRHGYPFGPAYGDFAGTDQIYVGSNQTAGLDGYSTDSGRVAGPETVVLDYGSLVKSGQVVGTLTLGIAADDFQGPVQGQPFTATVNGVVDPALTALLNGLNETGPDERYISIGIDPAMLSTTHVLTVSIDEGGNGGDGWAVDFFTVGIG